MTLRELIEKHPEMADMPIVVYSTDGAYHYVSDGPYGTGMFYQGRDEFENLDVLVFSADQKGKNETKTNNAREKYESYHACLCWLDHTGICIECDFFERIRKGS